MLMTAVRAPAAGAPADLRIESVPRPRPAGDEVLVEVHAAGVNRSDALACRGILPGPFPRTLGRDFAGEVVDGAVEWLGRRVWGAGGGDFGLRRDGSHAGYLLAPATAVTEMPTGMSYVDAAASGLSYFTAAAALSLLRAVEPNGTVVVTGAVGGVGAAAACLAADRGARVVGVVQASEADTAADDPALDVVDRAGVDDVAHTILEATDGVGAAVAIDTVGGPMVADVLAGMAIRGGVCVLSTPTATPTALVDTLEFYRRELHLVGLHTGRLTAEDAARLLGPLRDGFEGGRLRPSRVHRTHPLHEAADAYADVERAVAGRPVLVPTH